MNVLVIGSGGREHALCWTLSRSPSVDKVYCAPGNPGMRECAETVDIAVTDFEGLVAFARGHEVGLAVVGPEVPLTLGVVDAFEAAGLKCFGPSKLAARLEGSKTFAKNLMKKHGIPTAPFETFTEAAPALAFIDEIGAPCVIKADGLAAGKGVVICRTKDEAREAVREMLDEARFGEASSRILIEGFLEGQEVSVLAFCDGEDFVPMVSSQDHKRIFDNDRGPNTGGMGAYSPAPVYTDEVARFTVEKILRPTVEAMKKEGCPFKGVLYAGLMITKDGPMVLEYNARFGDPETQPVLQRLESDLAEVMLRCVEGRLAGTRLEWNPDPAVCVIMASRGYPESSHSGDVITGLDKVDAKDVHVFHSGTALDAEGRVVTHGGRVLGVCATGPTIALAREKAYANVARIHFDGAQFRRDIGNKAL